MTSSELSPIVSTADIFLRLGLAAVLGIFIGMEREAIHRPAGLRTHTLVSIGSALFTLVSIFMGWWGGEFREPGRIAAQIVSGIGFLGAGTILRQRAGIKGLTTAASLWAVAGIGMAAGAGYYLGAVFTTLLVFLCLTVLGRVEHKVYAEKVERILSVECPDAASVSKVSEILTALGIEIESSAASFSNGKPKIRLNVKLPESLDYQLLMKQLLSLGVQSYDWDEPT